MQNFYNYYILILAISKCFSKYFKFQRKESEKNMPAKIGLFYGTTNGNTGDSATRIQQSLNQLVPNAVEAIFDVANTDIKKILDYDFLIFGSSTWDLGELQYDWLDAIEALDNMDLKGKKIAIFGLGDQYGYSDTYQDAIGILAEKVIERGAQLVGFTTTTGHKFDGSKAVKDGKFMGLALDEDNQANLSNERIQAWVKQIQSEFGF